MNNTNPRAWLTEAQARAEKATPGPWENDGGGDIGQHWSSPVPRQEVVTTEVSCMSYCYGGSARGVEKESDAEFIAAARTEHPAMAAALTAVLDWCDDAQQESDGLWAKPSTGDDVTEAVTLRRVCSEIRNTITDHLKDNA